MSLVNSDRAAYRDLNPLDGGQSLYPISTVFIFGDKIERNNKSSFFIFSDRGILRPIELFNVLQTFPSCLWHIFPHQ